MPRRSEIRQKNSTFKPTQQKCKHCLGFHSANNPEHFNLDLLLRSLTWSTIRPEYRKSVLRPQRIRNVFIHRPLWPKMELIAGYEHRFIKHLNATIGLHAKHLVGPEQVSD
jgi:hypothetical protein